MGNFRFGGGVNHLSELHFADIFLDAEAAFESMDKQAIFREDPIYIKFVEEVIKPKTAEYLALDYEMDPGRDASLS